MTQRIEISYKTVIFTVFFLLSLKFIWIIRELIYSLLLAFIFMSALKPIVARLVQYKLPRGFAAFIVVMFSMTILLFFLGFLIPPIISESLVFARNLPGLLVKSFPILSPFLNASSAVQFLPNITQNAIKVISSVFSNVMFVISVFFFTFYFLLEDKFIESFLSNFLDDKAYKAVVEVLQKAETRMGAWMRGELVLMTSIGLLTYIGLSILGVPFALSLAFLAGLLEIVPIIGPIMSAIPAFIVASSASSFLGLGTLVLYLIIQQLENNLIVPYIMNKAVGIHPITTLIALSIGGTLGGILGAILAVPVALIIETTVQRLLKGDA